MEDEDTCCCDFVVIDLLFNVVVDTGEMVVKHVLEVLFVVVVVIKLGVDP